MRVAVTVAVKHLKSQQKTLLLALLSLPNAEKWWASSDSNRGPRDYESPALTAVLLAHSCQGNTRRAAIQDRHVSLLSSGHLVSVL